MKNLLKKLKKYNPPKHIWLLYFYIPVLLSFFSNLDSENDIYFLLNHGRYILEHGFPTIEPFTMHQGFSFVMQQWLAAVIFYLAYNTFSKYGLLFLLVIVNGIILFLLYKLCMKLSDNRYILAIVLSAITDILLLLCFILPRPQIFTYANLIGVLYIMECFYRNDKSKAIYFLPLISLLQINLHASLWFLIFAFILPYFIDLVIAKFKDKTDKRLIKLIPVLVITFLVGFINPYGIKAITYVFTSYGSYYINNMVIEMFPPVLGVNSRITTLFYLTYSLLIVVITIYIVNKKGKLCLPHMLLLIGVSYLAIRNYALLIIGSIPFLAFYLKNCFPEEKNNKIILTKNGKIGYTCLIIGLFIYAIVAVSIRGVTMDNRLEKGIDYLLAHNKKEDIVLYTGYNNGSYVEYRAEIFLKANNKKKDVMEEYYLLQYNRLSANQFLSEYNFTHLIIDTEDNLYSYVNNNTNYKAIYKAKGYKIFQRIN